MVKRPQASCHPERPHHAKGKCRQCYSKSRDRVRWARNPVADKGQAERSKAWYRRNRTEALKRTKQDRDQRKCRVLTRYGKDHALMCCWGECEVSDIDMLTLDHVNNGGTAERTVRGQNSTYRFVEKNNYPEGYQTLCWNHQWKKEIERRRGLRT